ncbi:ATP-binding protein [Streptomyces sp. NPDC126499]|uniref:ATP-binding protein n=1 Tax=Streptomyces sp. NPDC126499 TaxID=3155314 RepID=UPI00331CEF9A
MTIGRGARDGAPPRADAPECREGPETARRPRPTGRDRPAIPGDTRRRLRLAGLASPAGRARAFTLETLADWSWSATTPGVDADVAGDVVLVVAELVANSVAHGGGPLELVLDATGTRLRIEVSDSGTLLPAPRRSHHPELPGGHGLFIVERVTDRWGVERHAWGKTVWAEVDAKRLAPGT